MAQPRYLDTTWSAKRLLQDFEESLHQVRDEITDLDGASFACFPFQFNWKNATCRGIGKMNPDSPVCVLCRELHGHEGTSPTWPKKEAK